VVILEMMQNTLRQNAGCPFAATNQANSHQQDSIAERDGETVDEEAEY